MQLPVNKQPSNLFFIMDPGSPTPLWVPGPGPEGPGPLWPLYLGGNSELVESKLNALCVELASCWGVSEAATAP